MRLILGALCSTAATVAALTLAPTAGAATAAAAHAEAATAKPVPSTAEQSSAKQAIINTLLANGATFETANVVATEDVADATLLTSAAAAVPACVKATYSNPFGPYQNVKVTNNCAVSVRVKVIWAYATDSACHVVAPDTSWTDHHLDQTTLDRWDGIVSC